MKKICVILLILIINTIAWSQEQPSKRVVYVIDSTHVYSQLIEKENNEANYVPCIVGMALGGAFTGVGTFFLVGGLVIASEDDKDDEWDGPFNGIAGGVMIGLSIPFYLIGIPVLSYNIYKYNERKGHAKKRDEYQRSLEDFNTRHPRKASSVQMMFLPSADIIHGRGGLQALFLF